MSPAERELLLSMSVALRELVKANPRASNDLARQLAGAEQRVIEEAKTAWLGGVFGER